MYVDGPMDLLDENLSPLWHAFDGLDEQRTGLVSKTKLKVLCHNICRIWSLADEHEHVDTFYSSRSELSFVQFIQFLRLFVFQQLEWSAESSRLSAQLADICWLLYQVRLQVVDKGAPKVALRQLWDVFNMLAEVSLEDASAETSSSAEAKAVSSNTNDLNEVTESHAREAEVNKQTASKLNSDHSGIPSALVTSQNSTKFEFSEAQHGHTEPLHNSLQNHNKCDMSTVTSKSHEAGSQRIPVSDLNQSSEASPPTTPQCEENYENAVISMTELSDTAQYANTIVVAAKDILLDDEITTSEEMLRVSNGDSEDSDSLEEETVEIPKSSQVAPIMSVSNGGYDSDDGSISMMMESRRSIQVPPVQRKESNEENSERVDGVLLVDDSEKPATKNNIQAKGEVPEELSTSGIESNSYSEPSSPEWSATSISAPSLRFKPVVNQKMQRRDFGELETLSVCVQEEAFIVLRMFRDKLGSPLLSEELDGLTKIQKFSYTCLVQLLQTWGGFAGNSIMDRAIASLHDHFVMDVLKKGQVSRKEGKLGGWKNRWLVLTPRKLTTYGQQNEEEVKGCIEITSKSQVTNIEDKSNRFFRFKVTSKEQCAEYATSFFETRSEWVAAMRRAIAVSGLGHHARNEAGRRREARQRLAEERRLRIWQERMREDEARKRQEEGEKKARIQQQLEEEQLEKLTETRNLLHSTLGKLELSETEKEVMRGKLRLEEGKRRELEELLEEQRKLTAATERLRGEEERARKDEEIVRNLQAVALREELEKREQLEAACLEKEQQLLREQRESRKLEKLRVDEERLRLKSGEELENLKLMHENVVEKERASKEELKRLVYRRDSILESETQKIKDLTEEKEEIRRTLQEARDQLAQTDRRSAVVRQRIVSHRGLGAICEDESQRWRVLKQSVSNP